MEETIMKFIAQVGIPAGIAVYVLVEMNKTMQGVRDAVLEQAKAIIGLQGVISSLLDKLDCNEESRKLRDDRKFEVVK